MLSANPRVDNGSSHVGHDVGFLNSGWIGENTGFGNADINAGFDVGLLNSGNGYNTGILNSGPSFELTST